MADIDGTWERIVGNVGETFHTKRGLPFTYEIHGNVFYPSRTDWQIPKADFEKALELVPFDGPGVVNGIVQGPSYVWSVLHDPRVRDESRAEDLPEAVNEAVATKTDIAELRSGIAGLETRTESLRNTVIEGVATKTDIAKLRRDIAGRETRRAKFGIGLAFAVVTATTGLIVGLLRIIGV